MTIKTIKNNKKILLATVISFVVVLTVILTTSLAKYKVAQSIKIAEGTINYSPSDFSLMGIYIESDNGYNQTDTIPESGYNFNSEESYCKIGDTVQDVTISYDMTTKELQITPITTKGLKCFLYFDEIKGQTVESILAGMTKSTRNSFSSTYTSSTTKTVFSAEDNDGTSYYFAGNPTDNWVKFGGFYWRIIRFNGDGSIRLIYQGTSTTTTGTGTQLSSMSKFNSSDDDNMYVGYMYTSGSVHGLGTSSTLKGVLDDWYDDNLADYASYIDTNAGFCGDRQPSTSSSSINGSGGIGTTTTYYGAYIRLNTNKNPTFKCENDSDLYTLSNSNKGNKALSKPVGMITADEVAYAGGVDDTSNSSYYLYTGQYYWTISPYSYSSRGYAHVYLVYYSGLLYGSIDWPVIDSAGLRPVINLKAGTLFSAEGNGSASNPYQILEN